jgi:hypothetical protein
MKRLIRKFISFFIKKPDRLLTWSAEDFEWAKRWCKCQDHPYSKNLTLWEYVYDRRDDSCWTLNNVNNYLELK